MRRSQGREGIGVEVLEGLEEERRRGGRRHNGSTRQDSEMQSWIAIDTLMTFRVAIKRRE